MKYFLGFITVCLPFLCFSKDVDIIPYAQSTELTTPGAGVSTRVPAPKGSVKFELDLSLSTRLLTSTAKGTASTLVYLPNNKSYLKLGMGMQLHSSRYGTLVQPLVPVAVGHQTEGGFVDVGFDMTVNQQAKIEPIPVIRFGISY